jgi:galactosamine-6-phosphate isomerase
VIRYDQQLLNVSNWYFLGLDEWIGLDKNDEGSCRYMLDRHLFQPLKIKEEQICFFEGKANDPVKECQRIEDFIRLRGPIDAAVLGLGMNGHIGLNEPGTSPHLRSHITDIDAVTRQVGQKYFSSPQLLSRGITLGIATLMEAKRLILIVSGRKKAPIVKRVLEEKISGDLPATLLRDHPDLTIYLDAGAAALL